MASLAAAIEMLDDSSTGVEEQNRVLSEERFLLFSDKIFGFFSDFEKTREEIEKINKRIALIPAPTPEEQVPAEQEQEKEEEKESVFEVFKKWFLKQIKSIAGILKNIARIFTNVVTKIGRFGRVLASGFRGALGFLGLLKPTAAPEKKPTTKPKPGKPTTQPIDKGKPKKVTKSAVSEAFKKKLPKIGTKLAAKSLPFGIGTVIGGVFAAARLAKGDYKGAAISAVGAVASAFPGVGTAGAFITEAVNVSRDIYKDFYRVFPEEDPNSEERMKEILDTVKEEIEKYLKSKEVSKEEMNQIVAAGKTAGQKLSGRGARRTAAEKQEYVDYAKGAKAAGEKVMGTKEFFQKKDQEKSNADMAAKAAQIQATAPQELPSPEAEPKEQNIQPAPATSDTQTLGTKETGGEKVIVIVAKKQTNNIIAVA